MGAPGGGDGRVATCFSLPQLLSRSACQSCACLQLGRVSRCFASIKMCYNYSEQSQADLTEV